MKALVTFAMLFEVDDEDEVSGVALAMRQRAYLDLTELCERKGYDLSTFEMFEPVFTFPIDLEATL